MASSQSEGILEKTIKENFTELRNALAVSGNLLSCLEQNKIITDEKVASLGKIDGNGNKAEALLKILRDSRTDSDIPVIMKALSDDISSNSKVLKIFEQSMAGCQGTNFFDFVFERNLRTGFLSGMAEIVGHAEIRFDLTQTNRIVDILLQDPILIESWEELFISLGIDRDEIIRLRRLFRVGEMKYKALFRTLIEQWITQNSFPTLTSLCESLEKCKLRMIKGLMQVEFGQ